MATKKRRKSRKLNGLAGSPEHHVRMIAGDARIAERSIKAAKKILSASDLPTWQCSNALKDLLDAASYMGAARTHDAESGRVGRKIGMRLSLASRDVARVGNLLIDKCFIDR